MSKIFGKSSTSLSSQYEKLRPLTLEEIEQVARFAIDEAVDFQDSELQPIRELSDQYYQGKTRLPTTKGRSAVIVTKVRDAVKSVVPSLARIFTQTDKVAEFYSDDEEDQQICKDATLFCNNIYAKYEGYKAVIEASTDALKARVGIVEVSLEDKQLTAHATYNKQDIGDVQLPGEVTEESDSQVVMTVKKTVKVWGLTAVAPEEFIISHDATSIDNARLCGTRRHERISDLVEMGFDYETLKDIPSGSTENSEDTNRKDFDREKDEGASPAIDPTSRTILFTKAYIRMDADGDGIAELRRVCMAGDNYKLLTNEPVNFAPYADFRAEIQPHVFYPICLAEDMIQDQDAQTALLRSIIDNAALTNNPRTEVDETIVNLDDVKNGEIGAIVRVRRMGGINELATPFVAGQTLPVLQYLNEVSEARSGITKLSQGTDADALQSTTKIAAQAAVAAADARIEMMARNVAETGLKSLFKCILRTAIFDLKTRQSINLPEGFKTVDPSSWHTFLSVKVNVGLGSGRIDEKKAALQAILPVQQMIIEKLGSSNPLSGWNNVRETLKSILRLSGIQDINAYFPYVNNEALQMLDKQAQEAAMVASKERAQAQAMQQDAMMKLVQVEQQKTEAAYQAKMAALQQKHESDIQKLRTELMKAMSDNRLEMTRIYMEDDRVRDKQDMDFAIDVKKVGLEEQKVAATEAKVAAPRTETVQ